MPRDLLAGITPAPRKPRDLFAAAPAATDAQPSSNPIVDAVFRSNPILSGMKAGYDALPDWLRTSLGNDAGRLTGSLADAIQLPADVLGNKGGVNDLQFDPMTGQPQPMSDQMIQRASNAAGWMTGGEMLPGKPSIVTAEGAKVPPKLVSAVARDAIAPENVGASVQELGPAATVADLGDNTQKLAAAVATQPGKAGAQITNAMKARAKDSVNRVPAAVNDVLGPAAPPSQIAGDISANKKTVGPEYDLVLADAGPVDPTPLAASIDQQIATKKGPARGALQEVRAMLNINGADAADPMARLDTSAQGLFETRNAIDGMISPTGNPKVNGALKAIREQVDAMLAAAAPGIKEVDAKYRELSRQGDALASGANVLDGGKSAVWPVDNARAVAEGVQPEGMLVGPSAATFRLSQGARADIERIVGTKTNDRVALANIMQGESDWNPQKLAQLFGQDRADAIMQVVQNERRLAETENLAVNGSKTAAVSAAQQDLSGASASPSSARGRTLVDIIFGLADKATAGAAQARRDITSQEIANAILGNGDWRTTRPPAAHVPLPLEAILAAINGNQNTQR